jgi:hypothetical protein
MMMRGSRRIRRRRRRRRRRRKKFCLNENSVLVSLMILSCFSLLKKNLFLKKERRERMPSLIAGRKK